MRSAWDTSTCGSPTSTRAIVFYRDAFGFNLTADAREVDAAFLAAGDYHGHIA